MTWYEGRETYFKMRLAKHVLPYHCERLNVTIEGVWCQCTLCKVKLESPRVAFHEYPNCVEVRMAGWCDTCECPKYTRLRFYPDGHITSESAGKWRELPIRSRTDWWDWIVQTWRRLWRR